MKVRELSHSDRNSVYSITPERTMMDAVRKLVHHNIGALPVLNESGEKLLGIITERDVLRFCASQNLSLMEKTPVGDIMTTEVFVGTMDDDIESVMRTMTQRRIRHLPIIEDGRFADIISIGDVVKAKLEQSSEENSYLRKYVSGTGS